METYLNLVRYNYDYNRSQKTLTIQSDGSASVTLIRNLEVYRYNVATRVCARSSLPVSIVRPDWMIGSVFVGTVYRDGIPLYMFDKEDHFLYESIPQIPGARNEPKILYAPLGPTVSLFLFDVS